MMATARLTFAKPLPADCKVGDTIRSPQRPGVYRITEMLGDRAVRVERMGNRHERRAAASKENRHGR